MLCKDLMTKNIISINSNQTILDVCQSMTKNNIGFLPIIDGKELIGVITDRDIIKRVIAKGNQTSDSVNLYMTKSLIFTYEDDDISLAITKMADYQIKRIIILNHRNNLVGIITLKDLALNNFTNKYINDLLKEISTCQTQTINPIKYINTDDISI